MKKVRIRLDLSDQEAENFLYIQSKLGLKNSTEVVRFLIRKESEKVREQYFEHYNLDENGVKVTDHRLRRIVDVFFRPDGIWCDYHKTNQCCHIDFALGVPVIQKILRKKREEGWNLPDV